MHRGGAFIECYIAVAMPFAVLRVVEARHWALRVAWALLLLGSSYAMMVTFSRNGYAAYAVALLCLLLLLARGADAWRRALLGAGLAAAMLAVAVPVLLGAFAQERLARWQQDLDIRQAHWSDALAMRDDDAWTTVFGMGLGRFPETHFWRSREDKRAAAYRLERESEGRFLRLSGGGGGLYIDQVVAPSDSGPLTLSLQLRAKQPDVRLAVSLCEKWMLTSVNCRGAAATTGSEADAWTIIELRLDGAAGPAAHSGVLPRPIKFALHTPADGAVVDVTDISLRDAGGHELLANGDFRDKLDHWFFSTDIDPPWHIHSLPVTVLFEQGWFGVAAWALLLGTALVRGARYAWAGDGRAAAALAALLAFLVSGSLNTLIDEPRFLFLLLLVAALCCIGPSSQRRESDAKHPRTR